MASIAPTTFNLLFILLFGFINVTKAAGVAVTDVLGRPQCTVFAKGDQVSDVDNILEAFNICGTSGTIIFPEDENYWIDRKLNPLVRDVNIQWRGEWTVRRYHLSPSSSFPSTADLDSFRTTLLSGDPMGILSSFKITALASCCQGMASISMVMELAASTETEMHGIRLKRVRQLKAAQWY